MYPNYKPILTPEMASQVEEFLDNLPASPEWEVTWAPSPELGKILEVESMQVFPIDAQTFPDGVEVLVVTYKVEATQDVVYRRLPNVPTH